MTEVTYLPVESDGGWHRGDWMQTFTGQQFYPLSPRPMDIDPRDIAHALGMLCRYNGHVDRFYSVAEHCVLMSEAVPPKFALHALLHDASEAYLGDMIRPLKLFMPEYKAAEIEVEIAVAARFGLATSDMPPEVKDADTRILLTERAALMSAAPPAAWAQDGMEPLPVVIEGWMPAEAESRYLARLADLIVATGRKRTGSAK